MLIPSVIAKTILHTSKSHEDQEARERCIIVRKSEDLVRHCQRMKVKHLKREKCKQWPSGKYMCSRKCANEKIFGVAVHVLPARAVDFHIFFGVSSSLVYIHTLFLFALSYYVMASLFTKRLTCFYCGKRSARSQRGPVRNFRCEHCEADNFFDEVSSLEPPTFALLLLTFV